MKIVYEYEWIKIIHITSKPKTEVYDILSKRSGLTIGEVRWDTNWNKDRDKKK